MWPSTMYVLYSISKMAILSGLMVQTKVASMARAQGL